MKTCKAPNCISPAQSHNYCFRHGYLRTDSKKPQRTIKRQADKKTVLTPDFGFIDQLTMFATLWENHKDEKGRVLCTFTGRQLNGFLMSDLFLNCFAHILSKKQYPWFKLNPANVVIVNPEFHRIIDQGTLKERAEHPEWKWDLWDARVIAMKEEYRNFKTKHLLP